jgi:hypothetical protein
MIKKETIKTILNYCNQFLADGKKEKQLHQTAIVYVSASARFALCGVTFMQCVIKTDPNDSEVSSG